MNVALKDRSPRPPRRCRDERHTRAGSIRPPAAPMPRYVTPPALCYTRAEKAAASERPSCPLAKRVHNIVPSPCSEVFFLGRTTDLRSSKFVPTIPRRHDNVERHEGRRARCDSSSRRRYSPPRPRRSIASVGSASRPRLIVENQSGVLRRDEGYGTRASSPSIRPSVRLDVCTYSQWKKGCDASIYSVSFRAHPVSNRRTHRLDLSYQDVRQTYLLLFNRCCLILCFDH